MKKRLLSMALLATLATGGLGVMGCGQQQPPSTTQTTTTVATPATTPAGSPAAGSPAAGSPAAGGDVLSPDELAKLPGWDKWKDKKNPVPDNAESIAAGKDIYVKNCASCHGETGIGDGAAAAALDPKPRDFTQAQFKYGTEPWQMMRTIMEGVPNTGMAGWDGRMDEKDAWTVIWYVKSLAKK